MNTTSSECAWPYDQEIFYHLDFVPYIDLKVKFDSKAMLAEALSLRDQFVEHRMNSQIKGESGAGWKSLGLRAFQGDPSKTEVQASYSDTKKSDYRNTPLLNLCPETKKFLNTITDIDQCDRIRFMLLEPGAEIKTHRDSSRDVSLAINISLNMPEACSFWSNLNTDGTQNDFSLKLPFSNEGSVFLVNNAKFHRLKNESSELRMHIIFHGPIKLNDDYVLACARKQNSIFTRKEILQKLVQKKALIGESLEKTPRLLKDWIQMSMSEDSFGEYINLIVLKTTEDALKKITRPTLFPLRHTVLDVSDLDQFLGTIDQRYVVVCTAGTFVKNSHQFVIEVLNQIRKMREERAFISGHIIDRTGEIPHLHQQFAIIDVKAWKDVGCPRFGNFFGNETISFPFYNKGKDIHDDYTPEFLSPGVDIVSRNGTAHWGTHVLKTSLESGRSVLNISESLRAAKIYTYPLDEDSLEKKKVLEEVSEQMRSAKTHVYFFNNEPLNIPSVKNLRPEVLISVASGFKGAKILNQYAYSKNATVIYTDFSRNALKYIRTINSQPDFHSLLQQIEKFNKVLRPESWSKGLNENYLRAVIREDFSGHEQDFFRSLEIASRADHHEMDFVKNPEQLVSVLPEKKSFIIWVSNAFYTNHAYLFWGIEEAQNRYHQLAKLVAAKMQVRAFAEKSSRNVLFGESIERPIGFLTDGCSKLISDRAEDFVVLN